MKGTVLHRVIREHLETFRAETAARSDGGGLPQFMEREFREFLTCGVLSRGFARVRCEGSAFASARARGRPLNLYFQGTAEPHRLRNVVSDVGLRTFGPKFPCGYPSGTQKWNATSLGIWNIA